MKNDTIRGLIVRQPYAELIARGVKKWEIRKCNTRYRGPVALVSRGLLYGFARLTSSFKMKVSRLKKYDYMHRASDILDNYAGGRPILYVWVFEDAVGLPEPVKVTYARGARTWVYLDKRRVIVALKKRGYREELRKLVRMLRRDC